MKQIRRTALLDIQNPILIFDPSASGVSGDMIVGAVVDLGANHDKVRDAMLSVRKHVEGCQSLKLKFVRVQKHGFMALQVRIEAKETVSERTAEQLTAGLEGTLRMLNLSRQASAFARKALSTLIEVEGKLHHGNRGNHMIHLHEAGSIDTLLDIVGTACGLDDLEVFTRKVQMVSTPIAVGGGTFSFSHGRVSNPPPASLEVARRSGLIIFGGPVKQELATPTGLAILADLVERSVPFYPAMRPYLIGLGAGTKEIEDAPNILRIVLGERIDVSKKKK
jgi:pyridinium-3,5-bisthiocarboxylic acid mononucleotide nickel chelatase